MHSVAVSGPKNGFTMHTTEALPVSLARIAAAASSCTLAASCAAVCSVGGFALGLVCSGAIMVPALVSAPLGNTAASLPASTARIAAALRLVAIATCYIICVGVQPPGRTGVCCVAGG